MFKCPSLSLVMLISWVLGRLRCPVISGMFAFQIPEATYPHLLSTIDLQPQQCLSGSCHFVSQDLMVLSTKMEDIQASLTYPFFKWKGPGITDFL